MVLSSVSLSLLDFPLDIRAAMENALAREESCGFGDDVYSMSGGGRGSVGGRVGDQAEGTRPKYSTGEPTEILQRLLLVVHQKRETSGVVLRAQSQMEPCGSLLGRMSDRNRPQRLSRVLRFEV